eukprot:15359589-Ditylum_brightwellii.AAC.1
MPDVLAIGGKPVATSNLPYFTINTSDHPYFNEPIKLFQVLLPHKRCDLGLEISECYYYLLPFINTSKAGFPFTNIFQVTADITHGSSVSTTLNLPVQKVLSTFSDHVNITKIISPSTYFLLREVLLQQRHD